MSDMGKIISAKSQVTFDPRGKEWRVLVAMQFPHAAILGFPQVFNINSQLLVTRLWFYHKNLFFFPYVNRQTHGFQWMFSGFQWVLAPSILCDGHGVINALTAQEAPKLVGLLLVMGSMDAAIKKMAIFTEIYPLIASIHVKTPHQTPHIYQIV